MKRLFLLLSLNACVFHTHGGSNVSGPADVRDGMVTKRGEPVQLGRDPGEHAYLFDAALTGGGAFDLSKTGREGGGFGVELSAGRITLPEQHKSSVVLEKLERWRLRPVIGWMALRIERNDRVRAGPLYAEVQYQTPLSDSVPWLTVGGGVALDPVGMHPGPQATTCFGLHPVMGQLCVRGDYFIGRGGELGLFWAAHTYLEHLVRR